MDKPPLDKPELDKPELDKPSVEKPSVEKPPAEEAATEGVSTQEATGGSSSDETAVSPDSAVPVPVSPAAPDSTEPKPIFYPDDPLEGLANVMVPPPPALAKGDSGAGDRKSAPPPARSPSQPPQPPPPPPPPPPDDEDEDEDEDEDGMLRMSFMDHLEELRSRIIAVLIGTGIAFAAAFALAIPLWDIVQVPLREAVDQYGGQIVALSPGEQFSIIWMWNPLLAAIFMAAPWLIYQIWAFIAPGLYPNERKWAAPFIIITAGLFLAGGAFAYFVAFRFAMVFLLGIGAPTGVTPMISIERYFTTFVNVILGVSILFELPVVVFFLTLLRITTPGFLIRNARYAILAIVVLAAVVTPTPDPVNLAIFAIPMILLFFLGVFASYLLVLHREGQRFPWKAFFIWVGSILLLAAGITAMLVLQYDYRLVPYWPFLTR